MSRVANILAAALAAVLLLFGAAIAQQSAAPVDYEAWKSTAARAHDVVEAGRASVDALEELRTQLVAFRDTFAAAAERNASRIETLRKQIEALGPVPEDGSAEPAEIAAERARLTEELQKLEAPVKAAQAALAEAEGLIAEIDNQIRAAQAEALLRVMPSPLNPQNWRAGLSDLARAYSDLGRELGDAWNSERRRTALRADLPVIGFLALLGIFLLGPARRIAVRWRDRLEAHVATAEERAIIRFGVSLLTLAAPVAGVALIIRAAVISDMLGVRGSLLLPTLLPASVAIAGSIWVAWGFFGRDETIFAELDARTRRLAWWAVVGLGHVVAFDLMATPFAEVMQLSDEATALVHFPLIVLGGLFLFQIGRYLRAAARQRGEGAASGVGAAPQWLLLRLGQLLAAAAVVGPVMAAVGYVPVGRLMVIPTSTTLGLLGALVIVQRTVPLLYARLVGRESAADALVPVLVNLALAILLLPIIALVWGARVTDLTELWSAFLAGVKVGQTHISPSDFLVFVLVFSIGYTATRLLQGSLRNTVLPRTRLDPGARTALVSGVGYVGVFVSALVAISATGIDLSSLAIVAGALSVGIGFGLQNVVQNFVAGIILLFERPIKEGDWIEVGSVQGYVRDISVRSTRIETFDRSDVILPNADLISGPVTNYTLSNPLGRVKVPVGVAYGTDTRKVEEILSEIARSHPLVEQFPPPVVLFRGFGASSLDFEIRAILKDVNWILSVTSDLNHEIARRFAEEGIEIPFPQRDIWFRNAEALRASGTSEET